VLLQLKKTDNKSALISNNIGMTLIEIIISVALLGAIVVPLTILLSTSIKETARSRAQVEAYQLANIVVENVQAAPAPTPTNGYVAYTDIDSNIDTSKYTVTYSVYNELTMLDGTSTPRPNHISDYRIDVNVESKADPSITSQVTSYIAR